METVRGGHKNTHPSVVLDGSGMEQDIYQLLGYVHVHGQKIGTGGVFDSEHMKELGEEFLRKYGPMEGLSPKAQLNTAHLMKRAALRLENVEKSLAATTEKLNIHEQYMDIICKIDRSNLNRCGSGDNLAWDLAASSESMRCSAENALKKPESFDDIEDDWTAKGNGTSAIQSN